MHTKMRKTGVFFFTTANCCVIILTYLLAKAEKYTPLFGFRSEPLDQKEV